MAEIVTPEDLLAYTYALMASPEYVRRFWDELTIPGPRLPITKEAALFKQAVELGRRLIWLHTYGERLAPPGHKPGRVPTGKDQMSERQLQRRQRLPGNFFV